MRFNVLGPLAVTNGGVALDIGGLKPRTVLAMLVAHIGDSVSADVLVEAVWGTDASGTARRTIQTYISSLRSAIGAHTIERTSNGWRLVAEGNQIDAAVFQNLIESGSNLVKVNPGRAAEVLREALSVWHGDPYVDVDANGYLDNEITRIAELRATAIEARIASDLATGRDRDLVAEIEGLLKEYPDREGLRAHHMLALYRSGRQKGALESFAFMRKQLVESHGIDPSPHLQDLEQRILEQDPGLLETQVARIQRKAILVADPGDPMEIASMSAEDLDDMVSRPMKAIEAGIVGQPSGQPYAAGTAIYGVFDSAAEAASAAAASALRFGDEGPRMAIDWGDVEVAEGGVQGPPVARAAKLVSLSHRGQVLLSGEAQQALSADGAAGLRFETLGSHEIPGLDGPTAVYQLLVGNPPQTFPELRSDRLPPPLPAGSFRSLPGYELREPIGPGSVGELYNAYQPALGREVIIEVISRSVASDADFIRRFEVDVHRLFLLEHPNIGAVIDYWRDPEGAFVVYRHHRGGVLDVAASPASVELVAQVGSALAYAHSYGLVHGSVSPDRIFLDETGNGYLLGFPIGGVRPMRLTDHPEYIAPESVGGAEQTTSSDLFALAMLAQEISIGGPVASDSEVEPASDAIARALSESPQDRQTSVAEFLSDFLPVTAQSPASRFTEVRNPYKGLAAFHESDAEYFFGRSDTVEQLVERLRSDRFITLVGPSGSGKSSVVRAGLVPRLRGGAVPGSDTWVITDMLPGSHPFHELQRALERVAVDMPLQTLEALATESPDALDDVAGIIPKDAELLLVIDQFEELFTQTPDATRANFVALVASALRSSRIRIVATMRADFLDEPLSYSELAELLEDRVMTLGSPGPDQLRQAVVRPAEKVGLTIDPSLTEQIVGDLRDRPGALPLLQHALSELFTSRDSDLLTSAEYERIGGVSGSITNRAESAYQALDEGDRRKCRQLLLRLVAVSDDNAPTRRRVRVTDLDDLGADSIIESFGRNRMLIYDSEQDTRTPTVEVAHEALLTHWPRLAAWIDATREDLTLSRRLDEAIHDWEGNKRSDAYLLTGGRLAQHQAWTEHSSLILTAAESEYLEASDEYDQEQKARRRRRRSWTMSGFAGAAVVAVVFGLLALQNARDSASNAALAIANAVEADDNAEQAKINADQADDNALLAKEAAVEAQAEALAAGAIAALDEDPELSVLLGIEALNLNSSSETALSALNEAVQAHRTVVRIEDGEFRIDDLLEGSMGPDGSLIAAVTSTIQGSVLEVSKASDPSVPIWTTRTRDGRLFGVGTFTTDGKYVVVYDDHNWLDPEVAVSNGEWIFYDAETGAVVRTLPMDEPCLIAKSSNAPGAPFIDLELPFLMERNPLNDDGSCGLLLKADLVAIDLVTGEKRLLDQFAPDRAGPSTFSRDGSRYAYAGGGSGGVYDWETATEILPLDRGMATLNSDGSLVLSGNDPLQLIDVATGDVIREYPGYYTVAYFSPSERYVYAAADAGVVKVFDTFWGQELLALRGPKGVMSVLQMTDDEHFIATYASDGSIRVWDVETPLVGTASSFTTSPFENDPYGDAFHTLGNSIVSNGLVAVGNAFDRGQAGRTDIYELSTHELIREIGGLVLAFSPGGSQVAVQTYDGIVELTDDQVGGFGPGGSYHAGGLFVIIDVETGETVTVLEGPCGWYGNYDLTDDTVPGFDCSDYPGGWVEFTQHGVFSPDGSMFASGGISGYAVVWDTDTGEILHFIDSLDGGNRFPWGVVEVDFSPDGNYLVVGQWNAGAQSVVKNINTETWQIAGELSARQPIVGLRHTPDGSQVLVADGNNDVWLIDSSSWTAGEPFVGQQGNGVNDVEISPDGRFALVASVDGTAWMWDLETRRVALKLNFPGTVFEFGVRNVEFIDDSTLLVGSRNANVLITLDPAILLEAARARVTRSFTAEECETYNLDVCPTLEEIQNGS